MKELVVISGKGGTGKTSMVAAFAVLAQGKAVLADCDVDAADLHLVLEPTIIASEDFIGGRRAQIMPDRCTACGRCVGLCRFGAVGLEGPGNGRAAMRSCVDPIACEGCGVCAWFCPKEAIALNLVASGQWFISQTRCGPMVHARLGIAEENSGKLVSTVRSKARRLAQQRGAAIVIVDGPPGIGCPVIASITGASLVLIVTEPTLSGRHDMERAGDLARHFGIPSMVSVNKWDLNPEITEQIESLAKNRGIKVCPRVRYDHAITAAQLKRQSIVEYQESGVAADIKSLWYQVGQELQASGGPGGPTRDG